MPAPPALFLVLVLLASPACSHVIYLRYKEAGNDAVMTKDPARAAWYYEKAVTRAERMNPPKQYLAHPLLMLAVSYQRAGHPAQAIEAAERVLPIVKWVDGNRSQKAYIGLLVLGRANADLGRYEKAATYFQRALEISEARDGPEGQQTGRDLSLLAAARFRQGEFIQAEGLFERIVEIRRDSSGKGDTGVAIGLDKLGQARLKQKAYAGAGDAFTEAVALMESSRGSDYPALAPTLADLADVRRHQSRPREAQALLARANRIKAARPDVDWEVYEASRDPHADTAGVHPRKVKPQAIKASVCDLYPPEIAAIPWMRYMFDKTQCLVTAPAALAGAEGAQSAQYAIAPYLFFPLEHLPFGLLNAEGT